MLYQRFMVESYSGEPETYKDIPLEDDDAWILRGGDYRLCLLDFDVIFSMRNGVAIPEKIIQMPTGKEIWPAKPPFPPPA